MTLNESLSLPPSISYSLIPSLPPAHTPTSLHFIPLLDYLIHPRPHTYLSHTPSFTSAHTSPSPTLPHLPPPKHLPDHYTPPFTPAHTPT